MNSSNAQYLLKNTIAYRRIAEQTEESNRHVKMLAEASRNDAKEMKKLAYLTMVYLPGTFAAVRSCLTTL
jgi:hypothetical protein